MDDPTPLLIRDGWWVRFSSRIIDESHTAWGSINEDAYLFGIEFSQEYHEMFGYPEDAFTSINPTTVLSPPRSNMILSITQSQASTSEGISLFVANVFENLRDELGEELDMSQICNFLQSFTSEVSPGASTMALVGVVRYRSICYFFDTIRDEAESRLKEFRVKLVHAHDNGFNMKLVEYKVWMGDEICIICLDKFNEEDVKVVKTTVCSHHFHEKCIGFWIMHQATCPVCRNVIGIY